MLGLFLYDFFWKPKEHPGTPECKRVSERWRGPIFVERGIDDDDKMWLMFKAIGIAVPSKMDA